MKRFCLAVGKAKLDALRHCMLEKPPARSTEEKKVVARAKELSPEIPHFGCPRKLRLYTLVMKGQGEILNVESLSDLQGLKVAIEQL